VSPISGYEEIENKNKLFKGRTDGRRRRTDDGGQMAEGRGQKAVYPKPAYAMKYDC